MFRAAWRGICEEVADELAGTGQKELDWLPWEHGEPDYYYRVESDIPAGWRVMRYVRGEEV